jgi:creatinine amidohydrolase/Fe(II)-dependent formamide hydrolase-like protein
MKHKKNKVTCKKEYILEHLTWPEASERFKEVDIALLPVGSTEQHGLHLPLDTDSFDAENLAISVAEQCSDPKPLVLPLIPYGVSYHHEHFPGTLSISNETLAKMVYEIGISVSRNGIKKIIIINGHGGNTPSLKFAAQMINRDTHIFTCVDTGETSDVDISNLCETPNDVHAGEIETSTSLANRPEFVDMTKAKKFIPHFSSTFLNFSAKRSVEWFTRTEKISKTGVMGDPTKASKEKGKEIWKVMVKNLVELVEYLKGMSLDEIYQKRY